MTLDELPVGAHAVIIEVKAPDATALRLVEMGMTPNAAVTVTRRALLGDPLEIAVRGTRLCLRKNDAVRFIVSEKNA